MTSTAPDLDTAAAVLEFVRGRRADADAAERDLLQAAVDWAAMHSVDSIEDAAAVWYGDHPIPVAGEGAPLVAELETVLRSIDDEDLLRLAIDAPVGPQMRGDRPAKAK